MLEDLDIVTAGIPTSDGCPLLNRIKAFIVQEATAPTVEHVFRDRNGNPLDLTPPLHVSETMPPASESLAPFNTDTVEAYAREFLGVGDSDACYKWKMDGTVFNAAAGTVRFKLNPALCQQSGLYRLSIGFIRDSRLQVVNNTLLSIEPSLFGGRGNGLKSHRTGCPTIQEIRMQLWDTSAADNPLLENVEFSDDQIATAIAKPIDVFNSHVPPINQIFNTSNFPWRSNWIDAIKGYLFSFAGDFYRRNRFGGSGGGLEIDDRNKEQEYMRASKMYLEQWEQFVTAKKIQLNMAACVGGLSSDYSGPYEW